MDNIKKGLEFLALSKRVLKWYHLKTEEQRVDEKVLAFLIDHGGLEVVSKNNTKVPRSEIISIQRQGGPHKWIWFTHSTLEFIVCLFDQWEMSILSLKYLDSAWEVEIFVTGMLPLGFLNVTTSQVEEQKI